jgi:hypothetical protein
MKEEFLHFVWQMQRFDIRHLHTTEGESVDILSFGQYNRDAGPDFQECRVRIGDTTWAGTVEMHVKASDWHKHQHSHDPAYDNVILHVVLEEDEKIRRRTGACIPCLEMRPLLSTRLLADYQRLIHSGLWIPCAAQIGDVPAIYHHNWQARLLAERLEEKTYYLKSILQANGNDWDQSYFQLLARHLGMKVNDDPFEQLARQVPLSLLGKHRDNLQDMEALLFGQAGFLEGPFVEHYPSRLQEKFRHFRRKYKLEPMDVHRWRFLRLRPANFPTVRIAQLARLLHQSTRLLGKTIAAEQVKELENMFDLQLSSYWLTHYHFEKPSVRKQKALGKPAIHNLIINAVAPTLFLYGNSRSKEELCEKAISFLEALPAESNTIIGKWKELGLEVDNAGPSQALLHLKKAYCSRSRCLDCAIGTWLLNRVSVEGET